ncbi:restriction endonuclease subunit S [Gimesia maris]|uniref:Type-1 restriction enzyme EcoKI specificity protein n=1 Tax=Gimesia maris TaxID=122 RepID=A0ABX5YM35_9PLAN|nr:restriction endonuclease subunit S [Gimesia maris]EDL59761.1 type I restriction-modification system, S subunit [Gimesia maris DSM 8797]QEG16743.1 Type-1 restriction enzyme EcoKI specificity protein [Gimesia maris]QGQ30100.1 restriction endonuclease subunit S [Gimesia maris]
MSFPKYAEYKESGIEWLGKVPEHWDVFRMGILFAEVAESGNDDLPVLQVSIHHGVSDRELSESESDRKITRIDDKSKYKRVVPNDLVYNMMRAWQGGFGTVKVEGMVSPAYVVARPKIDFQTQFIEHLFRTPQAIEQMRRYSHGVTDFRLRLYWDKFKNVRVALPDKSEQQEICDYIDVETSKIDALVAEQRRLIELLKEKRQAVISHAVTKGLNPNAPMKDSGIEWLGDVPEHWEVCSLRRYAFFVDGDRGSEYPNENDLTSDGILFLSSKNIVGGKLDLKESKFISHEKFDALNRGKAQDGDLIVKVRGSTGRIGEMALFDVGAYSFETAFINAQMMIIRTGNKLTPKYLSKVSQSIYWMEQLSVGAYGTAQQQLSNKVFSDLFVTMPPVTEQAEIADFIDLKVGEFDSLETEAEQAIELLQERRTALISAAVTGKINVRDYASLETS